MGAGALDPLVVREQVRAQLHRRDRHTVHQRGPVVRTDLRAALALQSDRLAQAAVDGHDVRSQHRAGRLVIRQIDHLAGGEGRMRCDLVGRTADRDRANARIAQHPHAGAHVQTRDDRGLGVEAVAPLQAVLHRRNARGRDREDRIGTVAPIHGRLHTPPNAGGELARQQIGVSRCGLHHERRGNGHDPNGLLVARYGTGRILRLRACSKRRDDRAAGRIGGRILLHGLDRGRTVH